jgi:hypothetical protein
MSDLLAQSVWLFALSTKKGCVGLQLSLKLQEIEYPGTIQPFLWQGTVEFYGIGIEQMLCSCNKKNQVFC